MIINKPGKYILKSKFSVRQSISIHHLNEGKEIEVTQIDYNGHQIYSPQLGDWVYWDLPVKEMEEQ